MLFIYFLDNILKLFTDYLEELFLPLFPNYSQFMSLQERQEKGSKSTNNVVQKKSKNPTSFS